MAVKNFFSYLAGWDRAGIDCSNCNYFLSKDKPRRSLACKLHNIPLDIHLGEFGSLNGAFICKSFEDTGKAFPKAVEEFNGHKDLMEEGILYELDCWDEVLEEHNFDTLKPRDL